MLIENPGKEYKSTTTTVYSCQYHIVWATKYRRHLLEDKIQERFKELVLSKQKDYDFEILEMETMSDHVHLLLSHAPKISTSLLVARLKGYTATILRSEFPELISRAPSLWTRSKFVSTVGSVKLETVKQYIAGQKGK